MRFKTFLACLDDIGWEGVYDAQHTEIKKLWATMYPVIAELEEEIEELDAEVQMYVDAQPPI
jgi:hypothetical protein